MYFLEKVWILKLLNGTCVWTRGTSKRESALALSRQGLGALGSGLQAACDGCAIQCERV